MHPRCGGTAGKLCGEVLCTSEPVNQKWIGCPTLEKRKALASRQSFTHLAVQVLGHDRQHPVHRPRAFPSCPVANRMTLA